MRISKRKELEGRNSNKKGNQIVFTKSKSFFYLLYFMNKDAPITQNIVR